MTSYTASQLLPLSGIQHFLFCRRQWALIHVEQQWKENTLTAEGRIMHHRADDPFFTEKRQDVIISRAVPVSSHNLGLTGICDVVEFTTAKSATSPNGVKLPGREETYLVAPVEYKRGKPKHNHSDEAQLCAQAMCLEDMLLTTIPQAYLYYGQTRRRVTVQLTSELRELVTKMSAEMHTYFNRGYTPQVKTTKACRSCSLADICLPTLKKRESASAYIRRQLEAEIR